MRETGRKECTSEKEGKGEYRERRTKKKRKLEKERHILGKEKRKRGGKRRVM